MLRLLTLQLLMMCLVPIFAHVITDPKIITPQQCDRIGNSSFESMVSVPSASMHDANMEWILFVQYDNDIWDYDIPPTPYTTTKQFKSHKQTPSNSAYFATLLFQIDAATPSFAHLTIRLIHKANGFHDTSFGTDSVMIRITDQNYRKETQNLYHLYQNAQMHSNKLNNERIALQTRYDAISKQYLSFAADASLLPKTWSDDYLTDSFKHAVNGNMIQSVLNPTESESVYKMRNIFTDEFVMAMINEMNIAKRAMRNGELELSRPNSMNNDGFVLAELGYGPFFAEFQRKWISKITSSVYPFYLWCGESLDSIHGFTIRYSNELDRNLSRHMDESQITFNLCLQNDDLIGSKIWFNGIRDDVDAMNENVSISLVSNEALIHVGQQWHRTENIQNGQRMNLILWFRGSQCKKSRSEYAFQVCPEFRQMEHIEL